MIFYKMIRISVFFDQDALDFGIFLYLCTRIEEKSDILIDTKSLMTIKSLLIEIWI